MRWSFLLRKFWRKAEKNCNCSCRIPCCKSVDKTWNRTLINTWYISWDNTCGNTCERIWKNGTTMGLSRDHCVNNIIIINSVTTLSLISSSWAQISKNKSLALNGGIEINHVELLLKSQKYRSQTHDRWKRLSLVNVHLEVAC